VISFVIIEIIHSFWQKGYLPFCHYFKFPNQNKNVLTLASQFFKTCLGYQMRTLLQYTEVRFASFLSSGFTTVAGQNAPLYPSKIWLRAKSFFSL
jgi:hypothetical protein